MLRTTRARPIVAENFRLVTLVHEVTKTHAPKTVDTGEKLPPPDAVL